MESKNDFNFQNKLWKIIHDIDKNLNPEFQINLLNLIFTSLNSVLKECRCGITAREGLNFMLNVNNFKFFRLKSLKEPAEEISEDVIEELINGNIDVDDLLSDNILLRFYSIYDEIVYFKQIVNNLESIENIVYFYELFHDEVNFKLDKKIFLLKNNIENYSLKK